ncbi:MAG: DUF2238 domain-containing protein [candidate division Zixibacteria bacterium]|nr:DUF2238 domain-containing protein [candidate division Zixibacteria bacterium]
MGIRKISHQKYAAILGCVFTVVWVLAAIKPLNFHDWLLENILSVAAVLILAFTAKRFPLSRISYTLIFIFLCLHELGSHYTYASVPYDQWCEALTGRTFNSIFGWERNHYDRLVHFSYGLLLAYPIRELFCRVSQTKGFWGYFLPLDVTMSTSMLYELIEWKAAEFFGGELGAAYLGTQGDIWDAHKDMGLASVGALIAMIMTAMINSKYQKDFAAEWWESLKVKSRKPLGEDELLRLRKEKNKSEEE